MLGVLGALIAAACVGVAIEDDGPLFEVEASGANYLETAIGETQRHYFTGPELRYASTRKPRWKRTFLSLEWQPGPVPSGPGVVQRVKLRGRSAMID